MNSDEVRALLVYYSGIELDNIWVKADYDEIIRGFKESGLI